jgi:hypothetical protein
MLVAGDELSSRALERATYDSVAPRFRDFTISTEVPYCAMSEW